MDCTISVAKSKALISFAVTAKLICVFLFAYAKSGFSHDVDQIILYKPLCKKTYFSVFPTRLDTDQPAKLQRLALDKEV